MSAQQCSPFDVCVYHARDGRRDQPCSEASTYGLRLRPPRRRATAHGVWGTLADVRKAAVAEARIMARLYGAGRVEILDANPETVERPTVLATVGRGGA